MGVPLAARVCTLIALTVAFGACRPKKAPVRLRTIEGESTVLPRVVREPDQGATRTTTHAIGSRPYVLVEPRTTGDERFPLILVFHGDGGDAEGFHRAWPFERATGGDAFLAYLDGIGSTWDLETTRGNRDVAYAEAVIAEIEAAQPIDHARLFATGYSSGGFFANVLACHRPGLLRAIASNAGGAPYNQAEKWSNGYPKCPGQVPTAMLALHGERDFGVTLDSGRFSAEYWAYVNGCDTSEMETTGYRECRLYSSCPSGKAVGFCSIPPLGHWVWDTAAEASWTFFQRVSGSSGSSR